MSPFMASGVAAPTLVRQRVRAVLRGAGTEAAAGWLQVWLRDGPAATLHHLLEDQLPGHHWLIVAAGDTADFAAELAATAGLLAVRTRLGAVVEVAGGHPLLPGMLDGLQGSGGLALLLVNDEGLPELRRRLHAGDASALPQAAAVSLLVEGDDSRLLLAAGADGRALIDRAGLPAADTATAAPPTARWAGIPRALPVAVVALACVAALVVVAARSRSEPAAPGQPGGTPPTPAPVIAAAGPLHPGTAPQARTGPASAWDATHSRLVLFGGTARMDPVADLGDTWTWDGATWKAETPRHSPPARFGALLAPAAGGVMLVGGSHRAGEAGASLPLDDAWIWGGGDWVEVNAGLPLRAGEHPLLLAADPSGSTGSVVLLAAPRAATAPSTYTWDGVAWHDAQPAHPPPPIRLMTANPPRHQVLALAVAATQEVTATWVWSGGDWHHLSLGRDVQVDPLTALLAEDPGSGTVVLVEEHYSATGGSADPTEDRGGTWVWDGTAWAQVPGRVPDFVLAFDTTVPVSAEPEGRLTLLGGSYGADAYRRWSVWNSEGRRWENV